MFLFLATDFTGLKARPCLFDEIDRAAAAAELATTALLDPLGWEIAEDADAEVPLFVKFAGSCCTADGDIMVLLTIVAPHAGTTLAFREPRSPPTTTMIIHEFNRPGKERKDTRWKD
jgi:hypothetical protein